MDVDLLRPGTVPMSKDTVLWFEFLLNPQLLDEHLANPNGDPTPTDLIIKFLTQSTIDPSRDPEEEVLVNGNEKTKPSLRAQGLKIIALKVAAYLGWDLDIILSKLPLEFQGMLLKDLLTNISEDLDDPTLHINLDYSIIEPHLLFAIILYHRWVIKSFNSMSSKLALEAGPFLDTYSVSTEESAELLWKIVSTVSIAPIIPSFSSLVPLSEDVTEVSHRWNDASPVKLEEVRCQVSAELCEYWMVMQAYDKAKQAVLMCKECWLVGNKWFEANTHQFCKLKLPQLQGFCVALDVNPPPPSPQIPSITILFINSLATLDLSKLLEKDNILREVPIHLRDCYELDAISEVASGHVVAHRDGVAAIRASNMVRRALAGCHWQGIPANASATVINKAMVSVFPTHCSPGDKTFLTSALEEALASVAGTQLFTDLSATPIAKSLITPASIKLLSDESPTPGVKFDPHIIKSCFWSKPAWRIRSLVSHCNRWDLIWKELMSIRIDHREFNDPDFDYRKINKSWQLPEPYSSVKHNISYELPNYFFFIILCKAFDLDKINEFDTARSLINAILEAVPLDKPNNMKLLQCLQWELLLLDIHQFHAEWPNSSIDTTRLTDACLDVINSTHDSSSLPRTVVLEDAYLALLNLARWRDLSLTSSGGSYHFGSVPPSTNFYSLVASACIEIKCTRKSTIDLMDKVVQTLAPGKGPKGAALMFTWISSILENTALTVLASLLARIHNIINELNHTEFLVPFIRLWPSSFKESNLHYHKKLLSEMFMHLVKHALKLYPTDMLWHKLQGELQYIGGHHAEALKSYLEAAVVGTDYFLRPVTRTILEDHIVKNMIKCCIHLQCHAQGAVLCQLLEDVDYTTAFKALQETSSWDAMDSYYDCIWDVTLLEFLINLHTRRNEVYRKQKAILIMGLLELNSNNNEEIKREAENIRKGRFLRALVKQYVC